MSALPGYWMNETSGALEPVVTAYLNGEELTPIQVKLMQAYLRQWVDAPAFSEIPGRPYELSTLRREVDVLDSRQAISLWLERALAVGIDPL